MQVHHQVECDADKSSLMSTLMDVESYPDFIDGVSNVSIVERRENVIVASMTLNWIKKISYTIELKKVDDETISWSLAPGSYKAIKKNEGSWHLTSYQNGKTNVEYRLELEFTGVVPDKVSKKLVTYNLPRMIESIVSRAKK